MFPDWNYREPGTLCHQERNAQSSAKTVTFGSTYIHVQKGPDTGVRLRTTNEVAYARAKASRTQPMS